MATSTTAAPPQPPGEGYCAPNWYQGWVNGRETEVGSAPDLDDALLRTLESIGATVSMGQSVVEDDSESYAVFEVTLVVSIDDVDHFLSTAPYPAYANYGDRSPSPGSTLAGRLHSATVDGRTWIQLSRATSGAYGTFAWDLGTCVSQVEARADEASAAEARPGPAAYTG